MLAVLLALTPATGMLGACVHSSIYTANVEEAHPQAGDLVDVDGTNVHVISAGQANGAPVFFIHGASANANEFTWTLAPRLEHRFALHMADRPGHGYSARAPNSQQLGVQAALMAGALEHATGGAPAVVVGHSFGGGVALRLALDRPDLVSGLVLLAPVSHDWGGGGQAWYNSTAANPVLGGAFSQLAPIAGPAQVERGVVSTFSPAPVPENYLHNAATGLLFRPPTFRANANDVIALQDELAAQQTRYGELAMPIIVFSGALDTVINPSLHVGKLKHQAQNLELVALADGGHMPHHAHGAAVAEAITRLVTSAEPR